MSLIIAKVGRKIKTQKKKKRKEKKKNAVVSTASTLHWELLLEMTLNGEMNATVGVRSDVSRWINSLGDLIMSIHL